MNYELQTIFVGGTFDGLHAGHKAVLEAGFRNGAKVVIGLTSDKFISMFKAHREKKCHCDLSRVVPLSGTKWEDPRQPAGGRRGNPHNCRLTATTYTHRHNALFNWLTSQSYLSRSSILPIDDPYEPASSADYDALIITKDNIKRGVEINSRRVSRGLKPVKLIEVPIIPAEDGHPISSTRLRSGEVDHTGRLIMPESLRSLLQQPLGHVLTSRQAIHRSILSHLGTPGVLSTSLLITVGDMSTQTFLDAGFKPHFSIIDQRLRRQPVDTLKFFGDPNTYSLHRLTSGPGYISNDAINTIKFLLQGETLQNFAGSHPAGSLMSLRPVSCSPAKPLAKWDEVRGSNHGGRRSNLPVVILVTGEEDLLTLPAVLFAPDGSTVYYGQPPHAGKKSGLVEVKVGEKSRSRALTLIKQFHSSTAK